MDRLGLRLGVVYAYSHTGIWYFTNTFSVWEIDRTYKNCLWYDLLCVEWDFKPVKTIDRITYIVLVQTLNRAQSINRVTRCRLTPAEIIRINLILLATRVIWLHLRRWKYIGLHSCHVSEILQLLYAKSRCFYSPPLFRSKFRSVPFRV